jgi:hypothetical protein
LPAKETKESRERKAKQKQDLKELTEIIEGCLADGIRSEVLKAALHHIVSSNNTPDDTSEISPSLTVSQHHIHTNGLASEVDVFQTSQSTFLSTETAVHQGDDLLLPLQPISSGSSDFTTPNPSDEPVDEFLSGTFFDHNQPLCDSQLWFQELLEQPQQHESFIPPFPNNFDLDSFDEYLNMPF